MATPAQLAEKADYPRPPSPSTSTLSTHPHHAAPPLPPRRGSSPAPAPALGLSPAPPPYTSTDENTKGKPHESIPGTTQDNLPRRSRTRARRSSLVSEQWRSHDPRSSSTHSLAPPAASPRAGRRKLLLIFIHGFMGNETSFQSFPAHVHNLLTMTLAETHVVHTKIYPRYKSRKAIEFARDDFSAWLEPLENDQTDIILLGHSMGGLLAAEVALQKPPSSPATGRPFRHRILGTINFDTPFLGMHPGVVFSGIGSLFRPAPDPPGKKTTRPPSSPPSVSTPDDRQPSLSTEPSTSSLNLTTSITASSQSSLPLSTTSSLSSPSSNDPFFNAPFPNDVRLANRKGLASLLHFINKHSDGLTNATMEYFSSHLEFGGCLADYSGLKSRYKRIRALEDVDETLPPQPHATTRRIRFVNYYTASTGRPKAVKVSDGYVVDGEGKMMPVEAEMQDTSGGRSSGMPTPRISVEEVRGDVVVPMELAADKSPVDTRMPALRLDDEDENGKDEDDDDELPEMHYIESNPILDDHEDDNHLSSHRSQSTPPRSPSPVSTPQSSPPTGPPASDVQLQDHLHLPPLPPIPTAPAPLDPSLYPSKETLKLATKTHARLVKAYTQATKDRDAAVRDQQKMLDKQAKNVSKVEAKERERLKKEEERLKKEEERMKKEEERMRKEEEKRLKAEKSAGDPQRSTSMSDEINSEGKRDGAGDGERAIAGTGIGTGTDTVTRKSNEKATAKAKAKDKDKPPKPKKDKKFCMLPPKTRNAAGGDDRDPCWVRVYMEGVDEVGAHCGLFFGEGPQYEELVGGVGRRVEEWIEENGRRRER